MFPVPKWLEISAHSNFHARTKSSTWSSSRNGVAFSFTPVSLLRVEEGRQWVLRWPGFTFAGCVRGRRATGRGARNRCTTRACMHGNCMRSFPRQEECALCRPREIRDPLPFYYLSRSTLLQSRHPTRWRATPPGPSQEAARQWPVGPLRNTCGPSATAV